MDKIVFSATGCDPSWHYEVEGTASKAYTDHAWFIENVLQLPTPTPIVWKKVEQLNATQTQLIAEDILPDQPLHDYVQAWEPLAIDWIVRIDKNPQGPQTPTTTHSAGVSDNPVYVPRTPYNLLPFEPTPNPNLKTQLWHSVLANACRSARFATSEVEVWNGAQRSNNQFDTPGLWDLFSKPTLSVDRVELDGYNVDHAAKLGFWRNKQGNAGSLIGMLKKKPGSGAIEGNGRCGGWVELVMASLPVHEMKSKHLSIQPEPTQYPQGSADGIFLIVREWTTNGDPDDAEVVYKWSYSQLSDVEGVQGQDESDPMPSSSVTRSSSSTPQAGKAGIQCGRHSSIPPMARDTALTPPGRTMRCGGYSE